MKVDQAVKILKQIRLDYIEDVETFSDPDKYFRPHYAAQAQVKINALNAVISLLGEKP
jgi:hypothetical protein